MKIEDLKTLSLKIRDYIQRTNLNNQYQNFSNLLQHTLLGNQRSHPVSDAKTNLFKALAEFDQINLSYSERNLFSAIGYEEYLGNTAVKKLDAILHDENFDPRGVTQKVSQLAADSQQFIERNNEFCTGLSKIQSLQEHTLKKGEALLEITFVDKAAVDNIVDFEKWIDVWTKVIRAFSELAGERPESTRIVFVQKSSPLIIDMATAYAIVITLGKAVDMVLEKVDKYLKIKKQIEEIKKLKLENKKIEAELEKEAEAFSEKSAQEITAQITSGSKTKKDGSVENGLSIAIKNLFVFVDKGGRVDCPTTNDGKHNAEIEKLFSEVRKLQHSIDRLRLLPEKAETHNETKETS